MTWLKGFAGQRPVLAGVDVAQVVVVKRYLVDLTITEEEILIDCHATVDNGGMIQKPRNANNYRN